MKKRLRAWCAFFLFSPALAFTQQAGTPQPLQNQPPPLAPRPASPPAPAPAEGRIRLDVVVTDRAGKPVSGLGAQDFSLLDDGRPTKILSFQAFDATAQKDSHPAEVILLLDAVNEGFQTASRSRDEVARFLRENGGRLAVPVSVFILTDAGAKVLLQPSMDGNSLASQLGQVDTGLRVVGRSAQFGGIERFELSLKWTAMIARNEEKRPGRKLLIWTGPGWPLLDRAGFNISNKQEEQLFSTIVDLSTTLRESRTTLYSVSLGLPKLGTYLYQEYLKGIKTADKAIPPDLQLKVLATQSGGLVMPPDNDLAGQIANCVQDANAFYTISFDPPPADKANEYHDLKVLIGKPGLTARSSSGYYNQPVGAPAIPGGEPR